MAMAAVEPEQRNEIDIIDASRIFSNNDNCVAWMTEKGLLCETKHCHQCGVVMTKVKKTSVSDGFVWQCCKCVSRPQLSLRSNSLLSGSKIKVDIIAYLFFCFVKDFPAYLVERMLGSKVNRKTIFGWYGEFRKVCSWRLVTETLVFTNTDVVCCQKDIQLAFDPDGDMIEVELDESWFGKKAKYHRGTSKQNVMVFGMVERSGKRCVFYVVETNSKACLWPLIERHIDKSCVIYHDGLRTYDNLHKEPGYTHHMVDHSETFVTPDGVHTNTIEGLWGLAKQRIAAMHGLWRGDKLATFLDEFSYRRIFASETGSIEKKFSEHLKLYNEAVLK